LAQGIQKTTWVNVEMEYHSLVYNQVPFSWQLLSSNDQPSDFGYYFDQATIQATLREEIDISNHTISDELQDLLNENKKNQQPRWMRMREWGKSNTRT
jgi:hypothetical protein